MRRSTRIKEVEAKQKSSQSSAEEELQESEESSSESQKTKFSASEEESESEEDVEGVVWDPSVADRRIVRPIPEGAEYFIQHELKKKRNGYEGRFDVSEARHRKKLRCVNKPYEVKIKDKLNPFTFSRQVEDETEYLVPKDINTGDTVLALQPIITSAYHVEQWQVGIITNVMHSPFHLLVKFDHLEETILAEENTPLAYFGKKSSISLENMRKKGEEMNRDRFTWFWQDTRKFERQFNKLRVEAKELKVRQERKMMAKEEREKIRRMRREDREKYLLERREAREKYLLIRKARWEAKRAVWAAKREFIEKRREAKRNVIEYKKRVIQYLDSESYTIREIQGSNLIYIGDHKVPEELEDPTILLPVQASIACRFQFETPVIEEGKTLLTCSIVIRHQRSLLNLVKRNVPYGVECEVSAKRVNPKKRASIDPAESKNLVEEKASQSSANSAEPAAKEDAIAGSPTAKEKVETEIEEPRRSSKRKKSVDAQQSLQRKSNGEKGKRSQSPKSRTNTTDEDIAKSDQKADVEISALEYIIFTAQLNLSEQQTKVMREKCLGPDPVDEDSPNRRRSRSSKKLRKPPKLINIREVAKGMVEYIDKHPLLKKRLYRPSLRYGPTYTFFKTFCWAPRSERWDDKFFTVPTFECIRELTGYVAEEVEDSKCQEGDAQKSSDEKKEDIVKSTDVKEEKAEINNHEMTWSCESCTFKNELTSVRCKMCSTGRQPRSVKRRRSSVPGSPRKRMKLEKQEEASPDSDIKNEEHEHEEISSYLKPLMMKYPSCHIPPRPKKPKKKKKKKKKKKVRKPKPPKPKTSAQLQQLILKEMKSSKFKILEINRRGHLKETGEFAPYQDPTPNMEAASITMNCFFTLPQRAIKNDIVRKVKIKGYKKICKELAMDCCGRFKDTISVYIEHDMKRSKLNVTTRFTVEDPIIGSAPFKLTVIGKEFKARVSTNKKLKDAKCNMINAMIKPPNWLKANTTFLGVPDIENPWDLRFFKVPEAEVAPPILPEPEPAPEPESSSESEQEEPEILQLIEDFDTETEVEERENKEEQEPEKEPKLEVDPEEEQERAENAAGYAEWEKEQNMEHQENEKDDKQEEDEEDDEEEEEGKDSDDDLQSQLRANPFIDALV